MSEPGNKVAILPPASQVGSRGQWVTDAVMLEGLNRAADGARKKERAAQAKIRDAALEAQAAAHQGELKRLAGEKVEAQKEAHAHGFHKAAWMFGLGGTAVGAVLTLLVALVVMAGSSESAMRGAGVGAAIRAQDENATRFDEMLGNYAPCGQVGQSPDCPNVRQPARDAQP